MSEQKMNERKFVKLPLGNTDFRRIRKEGYWYADKTDFLAEFLDTPPQNSLFTRPRRFGKTLFMNMLSEFFDISKDSKDIFEGLEVSKHPDVCAQWMNQYPVLFLSLKSIEGLKFENAIAQYAYVLSNWCSAHSFLADENSPVNGEKKKIFQSFRQKTASMEDLANSIRTIISVLHQYYNKNVIVLIDEYDVPVAKAEEHGYYREMIGFIRSLFHEGLKDNSELQFSVFTGCLRIVKESVFTGLNQFTCFTISSPAFSDMCGLTPKEVDRLLEDAGLTSQKPLIKEWYDGYRFGRNTEIYCTWSVIQYVSYVQGCLLEFADDTEARKDTLNEQPQLYWKNTSSNNIVLKFLSERNSSAIRTAFGRLAEGQCIAITLNDQVTYRDLYTGNDSDNIDPDNNLWNIMYQTGYLTPAKPEQLKSCDITPKTGEVILSAPNKEVQTIFQNAVRDWFKYGIVKSANATLTAAVWNNDPVALTQIISKLLLQTISYHDAHEDYYHAFMAGLFSASGYEVKSNKEAGDGRPDLAVMDADNARAAVFEFKYLSPKTVEEHSSGTGIPHDEYIAQKLATLANEALDQINKRNYASGVNADMQTFGLPVAKFGVAFYQKTCLVVGEKKTEPATTPTVPTKQLSPEAFATTVDYVKTIMKNTGQTADSVMDMLGLTEDVREQIRAKL